MATITTKETRDFNWANPGSIFKESKKIFGGDGN